MAIAERALIMTVPCDAAATPSVRPVVRWLD
jgi:hypothetical protein